MKSKFLKFREEIIARCKEHDACKPEFSRLIETETETDFLKVLTDNWRWCFNNKVLDFETILRFSEASRKEANILAHEVGEHRIESGFCIAYGNSTVSAYGNSTVRAYGNSTVRAYGNSTVRADGNSTVSAYGNSTVSAYGNSTVSADGNSTVRADGNSTVRADGNSTVSAYERATINSYNTNGHTVEQYAICRYIGPYPERIVTFKVSSAFKTA